MKTDSKKWFHEYHEVEIELGLSKQFPKSPLYKYGVDVPIDIMKKIAPYVAITIISFAMVHKLNSVLEPYIKLMISIQSSSRELSQEGYSITYNPNRIRNAYSDGMIAFANKEKRNNVSDKEIESILRKFNNNFRIQSIESLKKSFPLNETQLFDQCYQNQPIIPELNKAKNDLARYQKRVSSELKRNGKVIFFSHKENLVKEINDIINENCYVSAPYIYNPVTRHFYLFVKNMLFDERILDQYPEYLRRRFLNIALFLMTDYKSLVFLGTAAGGSAIFYNVNKWWSNKKKRHSPKDIKTHLMEDFSKILDTYVENYGFEKQSVRENETHLFMKYKMKIPVSLKEAEKKEQIKKLKQLFQIIPKNVFINELIYDGTSLIPLEKELEIDDLESKAKTIKKYGDIQLERYYFTHPKTLTQRLKNYLKKRPEFSPNVKV